MKNKAIKLLIVSGLLFTLTACGASRATKTSEFAINNVGMYKSDGMYDYEEATEYYEPQSEPEIIKNNSMIIRDASIQADVENLEVFNENINKKVTSAGGYFENSQVNSYDSEYASTRYAYYRIRLPQDKLDDFLSAVEEIGSITSKTITSDDVTLEYVDVKAHIQALEDEKTKLESLLDQATNLSEVLEIEDRLSDIQYRLDSQNGQKKYLESRVSYSTVTIDAREERNVSHPIRRAFSINFGQRMLEGLEGAVNVLVGIITAIPVIIIITGFGFLFVWLLIKIGRKVFKDKKDNNKKE